MSAVHDSVLDTIGDTPVVRIAEGSTSVLVKIEGGNPTGSYKDRMALAMIRGAERRGDLQPGRRVVEFTGGSTGSSLAFVCAVLGYPLSLVSSDAFSPEKLRTMCAFGADVTVVPSDGGRITPDLFDRMRTEVLRIIEHDDAYWTDQFHNTDAVDGYVRMGEEICSQVPGVDVFCAGVGTAGMFVGVGRALRNAFPHVRMVALEPGSSPFLTAGHGGPHRVEGIGTGIVPPLLTPDTYDEARAVDEADARATARRIARSHGLFAGTSSALNVAAALEIAGELGRDATVLTVAVDTGLKYLAGDLF